MNVEIEEQAPTNFYFDEDINNDAEAVRQLEVFDLPASAIGFTGLNDEERWLQNKSEDFYNGMYAAIKSALWLITNEHDPNRLDNAEVNLLALRYDVLRIFHKKNFKEP